MASTYSDLKIELIGTGEQVGTWGSTTNTNLGTAIEEAITGSADVTFSSADVTLTLSNTNGTQTARNLRLVCTGTSGGARNLILGSGCQINKLYLVQNDLADAVTIKNTTGTGVTIAAGKTQFVFNDGTNVVPATGDPVIDLTSDVTGILPIANGGTGSSSTTYCNLASNVTGTLPLARGGTGASLTDPNADRILFWDDSAGAVTYLSAGSGLAISGTTLSATGSGGTVTSVSGTGTASGLTLSGTVTTSGSLTLSGTVNSLAAGTYAISISGSAGSATSATSATTATKLSTAGGSAASYSARGWVNFNGSASPGTIRASGNVSSVTSNGSGEYTVNLTTALSDVNYATIGFCREDNSGSQSGTVVCTGARTAQTTSATRVKSILNNGDGAAANEIFVAVFR